MSIGRTRLVLVFLVACRLLLVRSACLESVMILCASSTSLSESGRLPPGLARRHVEIRGLTLSELAARSGGRQVSSLKFPRFSTTSDTQDVERDEEAMPAIVNLHWLTKDDREHGEGLALAQQVNEGCAQRGAPRSPRIRGTKPLLPLGEEQRDGPRPAARQLGADASDVLYGDRPLARAARALFAAT